MLKIDYDCIESVRHRKRTEDDFIEYREKREKTWLDRLFFVEPDEAGFYYVGTPFKSLYEEKYLFDFEERIVYRKPVALVRMMSGDEIVRRFDSDQKMEEFLDHIHQKTNFRMEKI